MHARRAQDASQAQHDALASTKFQIALLPGILSRMDVAALTRQLVDIESITGNEGPVGDFLRDELVRRGFQADKIPVEGARCNVFATSPADPRPEVVFSTHMDTVPPFIPSSEDAAQRLWKGLLRRQGNHRSTDLGGRTFGAGRHSRRAALSGRRGA